MADIIITFRSENELYDCMIFTRQLAEVAFYDQSVQVIFNYEHFDKKGEPSCYNCQNISTHSSESLLTNHVHCEEKKGFEDSTISHKPTVFSDTSSGVQDGLTTITLCANPNETCILLMNAHLASCVSKYVGKDKTFRRGFWKFIRHNFRFMSSVDLSYWINKPKNCGYLNVPYSIDVVCVWPKQKIDYAWNYRIQVQIYKRCQLEESMAWLSTLGGGFSSLGDYFTHCAKKAGQISITQLKLAMEMADPIMAAKCRVFWAQSLLQLGYLKACKRIVWKEYQFAKKNNPRDVKLENMCHSVWNRLKYLNSIKQRHV